MGRSLRIPQCVLAMGALSLLWIAIGGDSLVALAGPAKPAPYSGLTWEQPPIEWDPLSRTVQFCGWDEPAFAEEIPNATESAANRPADDFRCLGPMPITSIHWWGSYEKWEQPAPPDLGPDAWRITFSANMPADEYVDYSRPGAQLAQFDVPPKRVFMERAGSDRFPDKPEDSCFKYSLALDPSEYFWPDSHEGDIFWVSITAVYKTQRPDHVWGWKTRPQVWMDGAVKFASVLSMTPAGLPISAIAIFPVEGPDPCGDNAKYDMAFALDTDPVWVKWEQPFTGLRDWPYYEDESSTARGAAASSIAFKWHQEPDTSANGVGMDATADTPKTWPAQILADDYECTLSGPVTQIDLWGCYHLDTLPGGDPNNVQFTLSIRADVPAPSRTGYSMPGKVLWRKTFKKGQFTVLRTTRQRQSFFGPCSAEYITSSHARNYKYTFTIDPDQAFVQTGSQEKPVTYWLCVQASVTQSAGSVVRFGWETSTSVWNDDAVWAQAQEPFSGTWQKLTYPAFHPRAREHTAMAFAVLTSDQSTAELIDRLVIDDWKCEQPSPVVAATWWGSYLGYTDLPCQCNLTVAPVKPDYFLLSIWSDVRPGLTVGPDLSFPGSKLWEYKAYLYDEVQVGSDKGPQKSHELMGREPVFRYSVTIPADKRFTPEMGNDVYWFSVVAVYQYPKVANYPWGWTNHEHVFGSDALAGLQITMSPDITGWSWQPLKDQTGATEDMSFVLFQQAQVLGPPPIAVLER